METEADMVNSISSNNISRLRPLGEVDATQTQGSAAAGTQAKAVGGKTVDDLSLSPAASRLPDGLTQGPPIDRALVDRIGEAIAEGRYPIKPDLIAEALFRDVHDMQF
jgi:negative regulator of flagellin synthesis FlgM